MMFNKQSAHKVLGSALLLTLIGSGCATTDAETSDDPLEQQNRAAYGFNDSLDRNIMRPVVQTYIETVPRPVQIGVSNFFANLSGLNIALNSLLQGKPSDSASDLGRFAINTTLGVAGIFDVATPMGLEENDEDLGQTLGVWGSDEGSYFVIPLLGPNSARDIPDLFVSSLLNPLFYLHLGPVGIPFAIVGAIDQRAQFENAIRVRDQAALDPYIFTREAYRQRRTFLIYDGHPPANEFEDFDIDLEAGLNSP